MIKEKFLFHNVSRGVKLIAAGKNLIILLFFKIRLHIKLHVSPFNQINQPKNTNSKLLWINMIYLCQKINGTLYIKC